MLRIIFWPSARRQLSLAACFRRRHASSLAYHLMAKVAPFLPDKLQKSCLASAMPSRCIASTRVSLAEQTWESLGRHRGQS